MLIEYARSFFPVLLLVLVLRSFLVEPYQIPSESMVPTLEVGDFILVNKYAYGLRLPVLGTKIVDVGEPKRGDVMVFVSAARAALFHQARDRRPRRPRALSGQAADDQRPADSAGRYVDRISGRSGAAVHTRSYDETLGTA